MHGLVLVRFDSAERTPPSFIGSYMSLGCAAVFLSVVWSRHSVLCIPNGVLDYLVIVWGW